MGIVGSDGGREWDLWLGRGTEGAFREDIAGRDDFHMFSSQMLVFKGVLDGAGRERERRIKKKIEMAEPSSVLLLLLLCVVMQQARKREGDRENKREREREGGAGGSRGWGCSFPFCGLLFWVVQRLKREEEA